VAEFQAWRAGNAITTPIVSVEPLKLRQEVEEYLGWCFRKGNVNATRLAKLAALRSYFRYMVYDGLLPADPTEKIPSPSADSPEMIPFTRSEVLRMFAAIDITTEKGLRDVVFMIMGAFAGFRVSECWKLNIEDVIEDEDKRTNKYHMDLSVVKGKRGKYRKVWIWKAPAHYVRALLLARISQGAQVGDPLLVSYKKNGQPRGNRRLNNGACDDILKTLAKRAGIRRKRIKTHHLRTTHACDARKIRGYDVFTIMERLGWKDPATAALYITRREPTYQQYNDWHHYWIDFTKVWNKKMEDANADSRSAENAGDTADA
jgi:integrase/recombinase XerD